MSRKFRKILLRFLFHLKCLNFSSFSSIIIAKSLIVFSLNVSDLYSAKTLHWKHPQPIENEVIVGLTYRLYLIGKLKKKHFTINCVINSNWN